VGTIQFGNRWWRRRHSGAIEDSFETAKNEFGLITTRADPDGWHRHVSLVMLASAIDGGDPPFAPIRRRQKKTKREHGKNQSIATPTLIRWSIQENPPHRR